MNLSALAEKIRNLLAEKYPADPLVISLLAKLDLAQAVALKAIGSSSKQSLTQLIRSADTRRDNSFVSLRNHVSAGLRRENDAYRSACEALWPIFEKNDPRLYKLGDNEESAAIGSLLADLAADNAPAQLAAINATDWVSELERDNTAFMVAKQQRAAARSTDTTQTDEEAFKQLKAALDMVGNVVNSLVMLETPDADAVVAELNSYIREANASARSSRSQASNDSTNE